MSRSVHIDHSGTVVYRLEGCVDINVNVTIRLEPPPRKLHFDWRIGHVRRRASRLQEENVMDLAIHDDEVQAVSLTPVDDEGNSAALDGTPTVTSSDASIVTVVQPSTDPDFADDPNSFDIVTVGPLGNATVTVTADADLGPNVDSVTDTINVTVGNSQAVSMGFRVGTPRKR